MQGLLGNSLLGKASLWGGGGSSIKNIQAGTATFTTGLASITVPISSVDLNKAVLLFSYLKDNTTTGNTADRFLIMGTITDADILTFSVGNVAGSNFAVNWTVIEFSNVKTLQRGIVTLSTIGYTLQNFSVSPINPTKSFLIVSGKSTDSNQSMWVNLAFRYAIVDVATIGIRSGINSESLNTFDYQLVEFN